VADLVADSGGSQAVRMLVEIGNPNHELPLLKIVTYLIFTPKRKYIKVKV